jgi:dTDP-glucose 4,6-dehydratase
MRLIVTGGAGFIGSAAVSHAVRAGHDVLTIDKLTYAGRREALAEVMLSPNHRFVHADVADSAAMDTALRDFDPDAVLHLAAESHVDRSIDDPEAFVATNVRGTFVLLEAALRHWSRLRGARRGSFRFVQVSTDEVFGALTGDGPFNTNSGYAPNSPYAASKAAADHFARAWYRTYGVPVIVTNCSNNYGPRQHMEKSHSHGDSACARGRSRPDLRHRGQPTGLAVRRSHFQGLMAALRHGRPGQTYLFGGRCQIRNLDLAKMICALLDARRPRNDGKPYEQQIDFVMDRPGHDFRYAVDPSYAESALGWKADERLATGLAKTVDWYLAHADWLIPVKELGRLGTRMVEIAGTPP